MGLLNRFFHSPETRTQDIIADEAALVQAWNNYVASTKEKGTIITALTPGDTLKPARERLKNVLVSELVGTTAEQKTEEDLLKELHTITHEEHVKRVKRLEYTLCYAETRYEYIHQLLKELWQMLNRQLHLVEKLIAGSTQEDLLIQRLKESWVLEQHILAQISERETFHQLFVDLIKGQRIVRQLTTTEAKFVSRAERETGITNRLLSAWTNEIVKRLSDKIHEEIVAGTLDQHQDSHFEFVNSPAFVPFVRAIIQSSRTKQQSISESTLNAFVHAFREWYNSTAPQ